jgi:hypothetical protein
MESINDQARTGLETSFYADATGHAGWKGGGAERLSATPCDIERERAMLYRDYAGGSGPTQRREEGGDTGKILS